MRNYYLTGTQRNGEDYDRSFRIAFPEDPKFWKVYVTAKSGYQFGELTREQCTAELKKHVRTSPEFFREFLAVIRERTTSLPFFFEKYALTAPIDNEIIVSKAVASGI